MSTATLPAGPFVPSTGPRLLTAADLAALPTSLPSGDVKYELHDGVIAVMAPPGDSHSRRQLALCSFLFVHAELGLSLGEGRAEVGIVLRRNPDRVVGADGAFVLARSLPVRVAKEGYLETIPELVIEVRSKNDTGPEIRAKIGEYHAAGVQVVWVLDADARTVTAHRPNSPPVVFGPADTLTDELLPGFAVPVAKLFTGS